MDDALFSGEKQGLDRNDGRLFRRGQEQPGEAAKLLRVGVGPAVVGDISRGPSHARGCRIKPGRPVSGGDLEAADSGDRAFNAVQQVGHRRVVGQCGESAQGLHPAHYSQNRLDRCAASVQTPRGLVQHAAECRCLAGEKGAYSSFGMGGDRRGDGPRGPAGGPLQMKGEPLGPYPVLRCPGARALHQGAQDINGFTKRGGQVRIPAAAPVAIAAHQLFQAPRRAGNGLLIRHECAAAKRPREAYELFSVRRTRAACQTAQAIEVLAGFQRKEIVNPEWLRHGFPEMVASSVGIPGAWVKSRRVRSPSACASPQLPHPCLP